MLLFPMELVGHYGVKYSFKEHSYGFWVHTSIEIEMYNQKMYVLQVIQLVNGKLFEIIH